MKYYMFNGLENNNKQTSTKKKINKSKVWKLIAVIFCVILIVATIILYTTNENCREVLDKYVFRKEVNENRLPIIKIESGKNTNAYAYGKYITILDQNKLKLYNKAAHEEQTLDVEISSPIFESNGDYLGIAEKNGKKIYLINNKNIVWQKEIEGNISSININKNGYVSLIITGTSHKTVVQTFDSNGDELFKIFLSKTNVIDTDISSDNKYLAIAEVNFTGIVVQSTIKIISIEDAKNNSSDSIKYTHIASTDDLIINIKYHNKNNLVCMYDKHIDILNQDNNKQLLSFENENVLFSDINLESKVVKILKKSTGVFSAEAEMQIVNSATSNVTTYAIENVPKTIYIQDDMIAINLGTSVLFVNENGWLVKKYQSFNEKEIQGIVLCNNVAGIISKDKIEVVSL